MVTLDSATRKVLDVLYRSRGRGERGQGTRTVAGLARETGLPADDVERVLTSHPELFYRARQANRHGVHLFGLRPSANVAPPPPSENHANPEVARPTDVAYDARAEGPAALAAESHASE